MSDSPIDVHCHFFNAGYAATEALEIIRDWAAGGYPRGRPVKPRIALPEPLALARPEFRGLAGYVAGLVRATLGRPEDHHANEIDAAEASLPGQLRTVPMMMDIYYILDEGPEEPPTGQEPCEPRAVGAGISSLFRRRADSFRDMVTAALRAQTGGRAWWLAWLAGRPLFRRLRRRFEGVFADLANWIEDRFSHDTAKADKRPVPAAMKWTDVQMSLGYASHMDELEALQKDHPETVFPFLAIDPRRPGAINLLKGRHGLVTPNGPFYGVKLYPALGYLPTHPNLHALYSHCAERGIPISAHCSPGGLPTLAKQIRVWSRNPDIEGQVVSFGPGRSPLLYFGHPDRWRPVLEAFASDGLKLNLCHFGGDEETMRYAKGWPDTWTERIIDLMRDYRGHVYTDFGYHSSGGSAESIEAILARDPDVAQYVMFGTDYVMVMLRKEIKGKLDLYFREFEDLLKARPQLATANPAAFLGMA